MDGWLDAVDTIGTIRYSRLDIKNLSAQHFSFVRERCHASHFENTWFLVHIASAFPVDAGTANAGMGRPAT